VSSSRTGGGFDGVLCIDKPAGMTSFDVVRVVRGVTRTKRVGHTGTLDPMATGVLVVCVGWCTRLVPFLTSDDKRYDGRIRLGESTTTDDAEGDVLQTRPVPSLDRDALEAVFDRFRGPIDQVPPTFSALHVDGERAHKRARRGETVEIPARRVTVHELTLDGIDGDELLVSAHVEKGTYIRSLARDIGEALGCGGHLSALRRTAAGAHGLDACISLDALREDVDSAPWLRPWDALAALPAITLTVDDVVHVRNGRKLPADDAPFEDGALVRFGSPDEELVAIAHIEVRDGVRIWKTDRVRPAAP